MTMFIGTAGWSIPRADADAFPREGPSLTRYAARFSGVEINSSFHRPHRQSTWARWAEETPDGFRFAVKMPKTITHERQLVGCEALVEEFLGQVHELGPKLAVLLVQLPPKLTFDPEIAGTFFKHLEPATGVAIVCEPRHASWFSLQADMLLQDSRVARAAADPAILPEAARPGGWRWLSYWRLHGSPVTYRSAYGPDRIAAYAEQLRETAAAGRRVWCMFDNTASSAATGDALALQAAVRSDV